MGCIMGAARGSQLDVKGCIFLEVTIPNGEHKFRNTVPQQFFVVSNVKSTYLSRTCLVDIGAIPADFPNPAVGRIQTNTVGESPPQECTYDGVGVCDCPDRELPPNQPAALPCAPTPENIPKLEKYIRDRYRSSAFNTCCRQRIPTLKGSPLLSLNVDKTVPPKACHKLAAVPLHWQAAVREALERDVRLGVIEKVPLNTPVRWMSRMVCTAKHDGSPRRTVDYGAVNTRCPRQTHHTQSPWHLVSDVPSQSFKTVLDNWNRYHLVGLATEEDKDITTFIAPWGRFRYLVAPQGFISSGDAFTDRMDRIYEGEERMKRCIDDTLLYDNSIEAQFHRTCRTLDTGGNHGAIFNPKKFQFCCRKVNYVGLVLDESGIRPPDEFFESIKSFPTQVNITDVRAWFGMVAQVAFTFSELPIMDPFRHLLSTKTLFAWSAELEAAFTASREAIIKACVEGVKMFDPNRPTCLATDWSKMGIGYWLCQKQCRCQGELPGCCGDGWQTVYMGSRFCNSTEARYAPIEGEALAAAWGVSKGRHYLLGMPKWTLAIDHKPLVPILSTKELDTIPNPRIMNQRVKLLPYTYTAVHLYTWQ